MIIFYSYSCYILDLEDKRYLDNGSTKQHRMIIAIRARLLNMAISSNRGC